MVEVMRVERAPTIAVAVEQRSSDMAFVAVEGDPGGRRLVHPSFRNRPLAGKLRLFATGKTCYAVLRGGEVVQVPNRPGFEVV